MAKQLLSCLLLFFIVQLSAQDAFERIYRSDSSLIGVDIKQTKGGDYLLLSIPQDENNTNTKRANVTRLSPKGDLVWTKDYTFDTTSQLAGTLSILPQGNFAFTTTEQKAGVNKVLTVANSQGDTLWSHAYGLGGGLASGRVENAFVIGRETEQLNLFSTIVDSISAESFPYLTGLDSLGNIEWAQILKREDTDFELRDAKLDQDSTGFILCGTAFGDVAEGQAGALIKTDSVGNVEWSRLYRSPDPSDFVSFTGVRPTADSCFIAIGHILTGNRNEAIVSKLDSTGLPIWTLISDNTNSDTLDTYYNSIVTLEESGDLIISSIIVNTIVDGSLTWMMRLTQDSTLVWQKVYSKKSLSVSELGELDNTSDGGAVYFSSNDMDSGDGQIPYLAKIEANGSSSCEEDIEIALLNYDLVADTLIWQTEAVDTVEERVPEIDNFNGFNLPTLQLTPPPPFCEGDPINVTFDATTENAVSYEWTPNNETTPSIIATEAGMYTVDVRIETDICFNLCDTVTISEIGPPTVEIIAAGSLCAEGVDTLIANASGGPVESFLWSTGENSQAIFISDEGTYDVTASNFCGSSSASINLECIFDFDACFAVPNAFTPDGDDANDVFNGIISEDCASAIRVNKLKIWNRWGQVVFESDNGDGWDGSHNGKEAPSDAYLFSLEVENTEEMEVRVITGDLVLLR